MLDWQDYSDEDVVYEMQTPPLLSDSSSVNAVSINQYPFATNTNEDPGGAEVQRSEIPPEVQLGQSWQSCEMNDPPFFTTN